MGVVLLRSHYQGKARTDLPASFTSIPGTVIQPGYGSLYDKVERAYGEHRPSERLLKVRL